MPSPRRFDFVDILRNPEKRKNLIECKYSGEWKSHEDEFTSYDLHKKGNRSSGIYTHGFHEIF